MWKSAACTTLVVDETDIQTGKILYIFPSKRAAAAWKSLEQGGYVDVRNWGESLLTFFTPPGRSEKLLDWHQQLLFAARTTHPEIWRDKYVKKKINRSSETLHKHHTWNEGKFNQIELFSLDESNTLVKLLEINFNGERISLQMILFLESWTTSSFRRHRVHPPCSHSTANESSYDSWCMYSHLLTTHTWYDAQNGRRKIDFPLTFRFKFNWNSTDDGVEEKKVIRERNKVHWQYKTDEWELNCVKLF